MQQKIILILILILLTGCEKQRVLACNYISDDSEIYVNLYSNYDDLEKIEIRLTFDIPNVVMQDKEKLDFLLQQLDDTYHFEDSILVKEYSLFMDDDYSLNETIKYLKNKRYNCE